MEERPPLGVIPKLLWYEERIVDLLRAIYEYVKSGRFEQPYWWTCELTNLLRMRENYLETRPPQESVEGGEKQQATEPITPCSIKGCSHPATVSVCIHHAVPNQIFE